jgi:hypothetical protein
MKHSRLKTELCGFIPETLEQGVLYVSEKYSVAIHLCACGCGEQTVTPFNCLEGWGYTRDQDLVTLNPSIGNHQMPCKSHYYIRRSEVVWV